MKKLFGIILVVLGISIAGSVALGSSVDVFSFGGVVDYQDEKEINGDGVNNIEIEVSSTDVHFTPSQDETIKVALTGELSKHLKNKYKLKVKENGDTLKVKVENKKNFSFGKTSIDLVITVPEKMYDSIKVAASSGDIELQNLHAAEIFLSVSSGDIISKNIIAESKHKLVASSGDIILENIKGDIDAEASSGSIEVNNETVNGHIFAQASSGDVTVNFEETPKSLSIYYEGGSGEGTVNIDGVDYEQKSEDRIKGKIGNGQYELNIRTSSGDFLLN